MKLPYMLFMPLTKQQGRTLHFKRRNWSYMYRTASPYMSSQCPHSKKGYETERGRKGFCNKRFYHFWRSASLFNMSLTKETCHQARLLSAGMCPLGRAFLYINPPPSPSLPLFSLCCLHLMCGLIWRYTS